MLCSELEVFFFIHLYLPMEARVWPGVKLTNPSPSGLLLVYPRSEKELEIKKSELSAKGILFIFGNCCFLPKVEVAYI